MLGEMLDTFGRGNQVVEVEQGDVVAPPANIHPRDLEMWLIYKDSMRLADMPFFRREEWPHQQHAAGKQVARHRGNCLLQLRHNSRVANRAEEAGDHIELAAQIEVNHIALV